MGELDEDVPLLKISPRGPVGHRSKGRRPGAAQSEPHPGRRAGAELPAITRPRRPPPLTGPVRVEGVALLPWVRAAYRRALPPTVVAVPGAGPRPPHGMDGDPGRRPLDRAAGVR